MSGFDTELNFTLYLHMHAYDIYNGIIEHNNVSGD